MGKSVRAPQLDNNYYYSIAAYGFIEYEDKRDAEVYHFICPFTTVMCPFVH